MCVVDLGAAPGSWTQVVREKLAGKDGEVRGTIIAMDILPMDPIDGVTFLQGDFREQEVADKLAEILGGDKVDVVLSDMAPNLSGIAAAAAVVRWLWRLVCGRSRGGCASCASTQCPLRKIKNRQ